MSTLILTVAFLSVTAAIIILYRQNLALRRDIASRISREAGDLEKQKEELRHLVSLEFKVMADDIMKKNASELSHRNSREIDSVIGPLKDRLEQFNKACSDSYVKENASRQSLSDQIDRLIQLNHSIGEEARNLTKALRHNPKQQGDWGEIVLETLLEKGGLTKNINFFTQQTRDDDGETFRSVEGKSLRPDVIIALPDNRRIIVDSKVSLTAFADYCSAPDKAAEEEAGRRHIASVRKHIKELSEKAYQHHITGSLGHVLMFVPNEGAYLTALRLDPDICGYAFDRKVVIVTSAHLLSVVQIISQMWRQDAQNKNTEKIAALGGLLYDKFVKFTDDLKRVEKALDDASAAYDSCYRDLVTGNTSILARAERLRELGARNRSTVSRRIIEDSTPD